MKRKPTHGGKRKGAGAPVTTGMKATPPIHFRVSASQHSELTSAGKRRRPVLTASLEAKRRVLTSFLCECKECRP